MNTAKVHLNRPSAKPPHERRTFTARHSYRGLCPKSAGLEVRAMAGPNSAFTMVEIAICIAIIAFALVAIIGVLPTGLQVQKQNREDTIIQQEGAFWIEAIRSGAQGLDYLTNLVDVIHTETFSQVLGQPGGTLTTADATYGQGFRNGRDIVGLLSLPKLFLYTNERGQPMLFKSRSTFAFVRALAGSAIEKVPKNDFAFAYRISTELTPFSPLAGFNTNFNVPNLPPAEWVARSNTFLRATLLRQNAYELKVTFAWPIYQSKTGVRVGNNRKTFRTLVSGTLWRTNVDYLQQHDLFFVQPSQFTVSQ
jgi:type II secretory pathway pseudopilin PulG